MPTKYRSFTSFDFVLGGEFVEGVTHHQKLFIVHRRGDVEIVKIEPLLTAAMTKGARWEKLAVAVARLRLRP